MDNKPGISTLPKSLCLQFSKSVQHMLLKLLLSENFLLRIQNASGGPYRLASENGSSL